MRELKSPRQLGILLALAVVYIVAGKLGLRLAFLNTSATAVWPPAGIALAAMLIFGRSVWPAVLVGAFLVNLTTTGNVATSIGIAAGNTLEGVVGALLLDRFAAGRRAMEHPRDIFVFALLAAGLSTMVSATLGVGTLLVGGLARWSQAGPIWLTWWLGDAGGDMVVAPLILLWSSPLHLDWKRRRVLEAVALFAAAFLIGQIVFGGILPEGRQRLPLEFLSMPLCIWAAFRFGPRTSLTVVALLYALAVWGTLHGVGPFARESPNESLLLLQAFTVVVSITTLVLASIVAERAKGSEQLRQMSVSDPLTALANYRHLIDQLEREIQRSQRTGRPFALLFLDVNGLKKINDRHGHLVGSRALWRVAEVLRRTSRAADTAARYGGDEFAVILPDADVPAAQQVATRVSELLAVDREEPLITISAGVALYPQDGTTVAQMLSAADRAQYAAKRGVPGSREGLPPAG